MLAFLADPKDPARRAMCEAGSRHVEILGKSGMKLVSELKAEEVRDLGKELGLSFGPNTKRETMAAAVEAAMKAPPAPTVEDAK